MILEALIDERGEVTDVTIIKGLPLGLDEAAVVAVRTWKFRPAVVDGHAVSVYQNLTVNFKIK